MLPVEDRGIVVCVWLATESLVGDRIIIMGWTSLDQCQRCGHAREQKATFSTRRYCCGRRASWSDPLQQGLQHHRVLAISQRPPQTPMVSRPLATYSVRRYEVRKTDRARSRKTSPLVLVLKLNFLVWVILIQYCIG